ncbi:GIY-YIG nuclease family protein [Deinococcus hopiensis]|uniref:T5orf172 domain-containing protein n=1 Tax=Deinococcus hopiensis KR-140 TaxID=695939 RepID=A0A1W1VM78_9DEIO|nr:GIY-YIG nuclease family protein [Deinococcus hopiensis]SMB94151.1 T5orf172 domain-containing protein [Deinococcus hopiensis KR-140]
MNPGEVYILINPAMPDMVKIGKTTRNVNDRVRELSAATGVPQKFILVYHRRFDDVDQAEAAIHAALQARGVRASPNREFFLISPTDAINQLLTISTLDVTPSVEQAGNVSADVREMAALLIDEGEDHLYGAGGKIADPYKAAACFEKAMNLGSALATAKLGALYCDEDSPIANRRKGEQLLLDAANRGVPEALSSLANFYDYQERSEDSKSMWVRLLTECTNEPPREMASYCIPLVIRLYHEYRDPELIDLLRPYRDQLVNLWEAFVHRSRNEPEKQSRFVNQLQMISRW